MNSRYCTRPKSGRRGIVLPAVILMITSLGLMILPAHAATPGSFGYMGLQDVALDRTCKINLSTTQVLEGDNFGSCGFRLINQIWFEHARSAITIRLIDKAELSGACSADTEYSGRLELKTAGSYGSTLKFRLQDAKAVRADRDIVVPGVRVTVKNAQFGGTTPEKQVGCIVIIPSAQPNE